MRRLPLVLAALTAASLAGPLAGPALASTPVLGSTSIGSQSDNDAAGSAEAFRFTATGSGKLGTASVYVDWGTSATNLIVGVYATGAGHPGNLLTSGVEAAPQAGKWNQISLSSGASVSKGVAYWVTVLGTGGTIAFRDLQPWDGWGCSENSASTTLTSLPKTWSSGAVWATCSLSAYVNLASTTTPAPLPPVSTSLPKITGQPVQGQTLSVSTGGWSNSPTSYTYAWKDCNSSGGSCTVISGATSSSHTLVSADVGHTVRAVVTATNGGGSGSATSAQTAVVSALTVAAPANTAPPTITGQTVTGQTLTTSTGTWSGSPTQYTYTWEDCNSAGASCVPIGGASSSTYTLASTDAGYTVASFVTATNAGGSSSAASAPVGPITAPSTMATSTSHCFSSPGACGFPDPNYGNVGASSPCSSYPTSSGITTSVDGQVIQNETFSGQIVVRNNNVTIKNVCVLMNGGGRADGTSAIAILNGSNTMIANTTVGGLNVSNASIDWGVVNWSGSPATLSSDYIYNCGECIHDGPWTINNTYAIANGMQGTSEHIETIYCDSGSGYTDSINANHDVLLAPTEGGVAPVAALFCNTNNGAGGACSNQITLNNSLLAGGAYTLYTCSAATSVGSSTMSITNNRFARCTSSSCGDANGYWPLSGEWGIDSWTFCPPTSGQIWSGNVWDDNNSAVAC